MAELYNEALVQNFANIVDVTLPTYLPLLANKLNTEPSALMSRIKTYPITGGGNIKAAAQIGLNGGFASLGNDMNAPNAGRNMYKTFEEEQKILAVTLHITDKTIKETKNNKMAMLDALDREIRGGYEAAKWNVGRQLFGNGKGVLTKIAKIANNVVTLPASTDPEAMPQNLMEGLVIDIYTQGTEVGSAAAYESRRIISVDRTADPVTFKIDGTNIVSQTNGFVTVQMSYGNEITGLGAIFDDSIDKIYGVKKADMPLIKPVVVDAENDINDSIIWDALREADEVKNAQTDMLIMGKDAYRNYVEYLRVNNIRNESTDFKITGGFTAISYLYGNNRVAVVSDKFVPKDQVWGFDTKSLGFYQLADWNFVSQGGSAFNLMPGTLVFNAVLAKYGNLICTNPGGCIQIKNAA